MRCSLNLVLITLTLLFPAYTFAEEGEKPQIGDPVEDTGTFLALPNGEQLQLIIEDRQLVARFVDAERKLIKIPAESILVIVNQATHRQNRWRTVLSPVNELELSSPLRFHGPNRFRARIIIRYADKDPVSWGTVAIDLDRAP